METETKTKFQSTATIFGQMDAWCRGIQEVYNIVSNINNVLPRPLLHIENSYGAVQIFAGSDLLYSLPVWDCPVLLEALPRLRLVSDFVWALHKSIVSETLNDSMNSSYSS